MFHAGRYLDDKEICYLKTVIVTANVYQWNQLINTGHIVENVYINLAKFFTLLYDEQNKLTERQSCLNDLQDIQEYY